MKQKLLHTMVVLLACLGAHAQVNSGSNGSDGAFNPTTNTVINMADHPDGIYHYSSVNIRADVSVTFIPNARNSPVVWLVQGDCRIEGTVDVSGSSVGSSPIGVLGGPGGYRGGNAGTAATPGEGPGGGYSGAEGNGPYGGNGSYASKGEKPWNQIAPSGAMYGNRFLLPLLGGSGGGGSGENGGMAGGAGGGGAILIASSGTIHISEGGKILALGGSATAGSPGGAGSGGAIRLAATKIEGGGLVDASPGRSTVTAWLSSLAGTGRVRFDYFSTSFGGTIRGDFSQGFQPIILPAPGEGMQLSIQTVGGVAVPLKPSGVIAMPDAILSAQQDNPISVVVHCSNIPLNTHITLTVKPASGLAVSATGLNNTGTLASSTATISITMPRGGGLIYATAAN